MNHGWRRMRIGVPAVMRRLLGGAGVIAVPLAAAVSHGAEGPGVALTVYNNDLGLVKDVRVVTLSKGSQELRFDDVASRIDPTSVHFRALEHSGEVVLLEQNYQYDLADPDRLLSRYLNRQVIASLKEGGGEKSGKLLSFDGGNLVLQSDGGAVSVVNRAEVRTVNLGELPGGLVVKPTLVWTLSSDRAGSEPVEVSYLTGGINWHAEYVAVVNQADTELDLTGWVSVDNQSGATYENAKLKLVAGEVNRVRPEVPPFARDMKILQGVAEAQPQFAEEAFFEYHLYTLDHPATVRDRETKQLSLFPTAQAQVLKKLTYDGARKGKEVDVSLELRNSRANGLGMPLPKGTVRVYKKARDEAQEFVGEDRIEHTPADEKLTLTLGKAFDVVGERTQTDFQRIDERVHRFSIKVEIRNHKKEAVDVTVIEHLPGDWTITDKSHDYTKKDSGTVEFPVKVAADGSVTVTYTARVRY